MDSAKTYLVLERGTRLTYTVNGITAALNKTDELRKNPNQDRIDIYVLWEPDPRS